LHCRSFPTPRAALGRDREYRVSDMSRGGGRSATIERKIPPTHSRCFASASLKSTAAEGRLCPSPPRAPRVGGRGIESRSRDAPVCHCEERQRRSNPERRFSLDCFAELVIGPATSGRTRWLAMTSRSRGAPERPSYGKLLTEIVTTGLDPVVMQTARTQTPVEALCERIFSMDARHRRATRRRSTNGYARA
jgi:hypothetical protein